MLFFGKMLDPQPPSTVTGVITRITPTRRSVKVSSR